MSGASERLLSDHVYDRLRALLGGSGFEPGTRLPAELALAERLSVSRPVLRQALQRLRAEGYVTARKGSGNYVSERPREPAPISYGPLLGIPDLRCFLQFRCVLEGEIAAQAAQRHDAAELDAVRERRLWYERAVAAGEPGFDMDIAFHLAVAQATGNRFYVLTLESLRGHLLFGMRLIRELSGQPLPQRFDNVCREHAAIEQALRAGDAAAARQAMVSHLQGGIVRLFGQLDAGG